MLKSPLYEGEENIDEISMYICLFERKLDNLIGRESAEEWEDA